MSIKKIIITLSSVHPKVVLKNEVSFKNWIYLGEDYVSFKKWKESLRSSVKNCNNPKMQEKISLQAKEEYSELLEEFNITFNNSNYWGLPLFLREPIRENSFAQFCYIKLIENFFNEGSLPDLIVVESPGLLTYFQEKFHSSGIDVLIYPKKIAFSLISDTHVIFSIKKLIWVFLSTAFMYIYHTKNSIFSTENRSNKSETLLVTHVHNSSFDTNNEFNDRYFPGLLHFFSENHHPDVTILPRFSIQSKNYIPILRKMENSKYSFVAVEQNISVVHIIIGLFFTFYSFFKISYSYFFTFQSTYKYIMKLDIFRNFFANSFESYIIYHSARNLIKKNPMINQVILWYENQLFDKSIIKGMRSIQPCITIKGYQGFILYPLWLNHYPSHFEYDSDLLPDIILTTNNSQKIIINHHVSQLKTINAPSLRYLHVFKEDFRENKSSQIKQNLVIMLPYSVNESIEIIDKILSIDIDLINFYALSIKPHPDNDIDIFTKYIDRNKQKITIIDPITKTDDILKKANLVIGSSSSVLVEAVIWGIPTIFLARTIGLSFDPIREKKIVHYHRVYSDSELNKSINYFSSIDEQILDLFQREGDYLKSQYFTAKMNESMKCFMYEQ